MRKNHIALSTEIPIFKNSANARNTTEDSTTNKTTDTHSA